MTGAPSGKESGIIVAATIAGTFWLEIEKWLTFLPNAS